MSREIEVRDWEDGGTKITENTNQSRKKKPKYEPRRKTCRNCDGKKWFPSAIGEIACQMCDATGKGGIDLEWLVADWRRLKEMEAKRGQPEYLSEALNTGSGIYKP